MKKFLCLCLLFFAMVACSSEKDTKPNPANTPAVSAVEAPEAQGPVTRLSGEYVLTETVSKKTKIGSEEYTCQTTHTYTLVFGGGDTVQYTAKTDQSIDPPAENENMMCFSKRYNVDVSGSYEIKDGRTVTLIFPPSGEKIPWVDKGVMALRLKSADALEIIHNGSLFRKQ